jgi:hypothetical protein
MSELNISMAEVCRRIECNRIFDDSSRDCTIKCASLECCLEEGKIRSVICFNHPIRFRFHSLGGVAKEPLSVALWRRLGRAINSNPTLTCLDLYLCKHFREIAPSDHPLNGCIRAFYNELKQNKSIVQLSLHQVEYILPSFDLVYFLHHNTNMKDLTLNHYHNGGRYNENGILEYENARKVDLDMLLCNSSVVQTIRLKM